MVEEISDLDSLIGAFNKVLDKEFNLVTKNSWFGISTFKRKVDMFNLHKEITKKVIVQADKIYKNAVEVGRNDEEQIKQVLESAQKFFTLFNKNVDEYIENTDYLSEQDDDSEEINFTQEIDFQSDLTKVQFSLQETMKKISSATTNTTLRIDLFNNVKIPAILSGMGKQTHPEIEAFLEERRKRENEKTKS